MINEIGKYKDTTSYLPKVKEKVLEMKNITDSILNLNISNKELNIDKVDLKECVDNVISSYDVQIKEKNITLKGDYDDKFIDTDREILYKIIDNLIGNGIKYVEKRGKIEIKIKDNYLSIINYGSHIDENLMPHIFEPFVSSSTKEKGHGLGLYIVAFYCELLEIEVKIENIDEGVEARIVIEN